MKLRFLHLAALIGLWVAWMFTNNVILLLLFAVGVALYVICALIIMLKET